MKSDAIKTSFINSLLIFPTIIVLVAKYTDLKLRFDADSFPTLAETLGQVCIFMLLDDLTFYTVHRAIHVPFLYKIIHKKHHEHM